MKLIIKLNSEILYNGNTSLFNEIIPMVGDRISFDGDCMDEKPCKQYYTVITRTFEAYKSLFNSYVEQTCILQVSKE